MSAAKALALTLDVPYVGVNHLEAHLHAAWLEDPDVELPLAVLIVSGGHTMVVIVEGDARYRLLGQTVDDAAGEAFDKVARFLGLGYPGGPVDRPARARRRPDARSRSRARCATTASTSRSPASRPRSSTHVRRHPDDRGARPRGVVPGGGRRRARSTKLVAAADAAGARTLVIGGGVAANSRLRARVLEAAEASGRPALLPRLELCTDNGAMIAATAWWRLRTRRPHLPRLAAPSPPSASPTRRLSDAGRSGTVGAERRQFAWSGVGCYLDLALPIPEC